MSKGFWGVIVIVVLIFAGIFAFSGHKTADSPGKSPSSMPTQHMEGKGSSGVTVVEYGDYQCPFCGNAYAPIKQAVTDLNDQIYFQFRNYPLTNLHPNAFSAARAAEAASMQNKFWEMHDALYETQDQWSKMSDASPYFDQLAQQIGLDTTKFKADYMSSKVNDLINADVAAGTKLNIQGTPAFFINGKQTDLPYSKGADAVEKVIKDAIAQKSPGN
jgi:protein-disulfide isomerase